MDAKKVLIFASLFLLWGCPGEEPGANDGTDPDAGEVNDTEGDAGGDTDGDADQEQPPDYPLATCDSLDPSICSFPWPSNLYLEPNDERASGYRLTFAEESFGANDNGVYPSPDLVDHLDGYDLGVPLMVNFPNLDASGLPNEYELEDSMSDEASILLYEVGDDGLRRVPYWAELDDFEDDTARKTLFVRPAEILEMNTRYIVAFRDLVDTDGDPIEPSETFTRLVEGDTGDDEVLRHRQERFDDIFDQLGGEGVDPASLVLAWDFVTASSEALHGPMLTVRDDAYEYADSEGITWSVDSATRYSNDDQDGTYDPHIGAEVEATMEVPHYMEEYEPLDKAWQFHRVDGEIRQNGTRQVPVYARIPHGAFDENEVGVVVFGHGLLGDREQIDDGTWDQIADELGVIMVAVDLVGMSREEVDVVSEAVFDPNHFVGVSDRLHQGLLEYLLLASTAAEGLSGLEPDSEEISDYDISVDPKDVHYLGGSQGGIFGSTFMALTNDVERGYLGVPGNNYSTLLHRSTHYAAFNEIMRIAFPDTRDRNVALALFSLLWSTTEPVSYLRHIRAEPLEDDEPRDAFLAVAKGDRQVATITNENTARSEVEIPLLENYDEDRTPYDAETVSYPHDGSGIVLYDFGNPWPEPGNHPPDDDVGDPHAWLGSVDVHLDQIDTFFRDGQIVDICDGEPCQFPPP